MGSRGRVARLVLLGVGVLVAVVLLTAATFQSPRESALDIQVVGILRYNGYVWIAVHDAAGPVTKIQRGNVRVESLMYPFREMDGPPSREDPLSPEMVDFHNLGDGVYEIKLLPTAGEEWWKPGWDYVIKIYVESPAGTGSGLGTFHWWEVGQ